MKTSVDVKLKEYDLKLLEKDMIEYQYLWDTKKLDRICSRVNKLTKGTILRRLLKRI